MLCDHCLSLGCDQRACDQCACDQRVCTARSDQPHDADNTDANRLDDSGGEKLKVGLERVHFNQKTPHLSGRAELLKDKRTGAVCHRPVYCTRRS